MKKILLIFFCFIEFFIIGEWLFFEISSQIIDKTIVWLLQIQLLVIYILVFYTSKKYITPKWTSLYNIFLFVLMIFLYYRIFASLFIDDINFYQYQYLSNIYLNYSQQVELLLVLAFSINSLHLGAFLSFIIQNKKNYNNLHYNISMKKMGLLLFAMGLPGAIYKNYLYIIFVKSNGYLALYAGSINLTIPFWSNISGALFIIGLIFTFASLPSKKTVLTVIFIYLSINLMSLFIGNRGAFIVKLLFVVWYYYRFYTNKDINILKIFFIGLGMVIIMARLAYSRMNLIAENIDFYDLILNFFNQSGVSLGVLANQIFYKNIFINSGLPYILNPFIAPYVPSIQSPERIKETLSLADHLTYFLDSSRYFAGVGFGNSYIGELYDIGFLGVLFGSFILGYFLIYFSLKVSNNILFLLMSYYIVTCVVWMPRGSFFPAINTMLIVIAFYYILVFFKIIKSKNQERTKI